MPLEAPALLFSLDERFHRLQRLAERYLSAIIGDLETEEKFYDDPHWYSFPQVAEAVRNAGAGWHFCSIAMCPRHKVWAVGMGGTRMNRYKAAEIALCMAFTWGTDHYKQLLAEWGGTSRDEAEVTSPEVSAQPSVRSS